MDKGIVTTTDGTRYDGSGATAQVRWDRLAFIANPENRARHRKADGDLDLEALRAAAVAAHPA